MSTEPTIQASQLAPAHAFLRWIEITNLVLTAVAVVVTHLMIGWGPFAMGVLVGGGVSSLSLFALRWLGGRVFTADKRSKGAYMVLLTVKVMATGGLVWAALQWLPVHPFGFLLGFSMLMAAIVIATLRMSLVPPHSASETAQRGHAG